MPAVNDDALPEGYLLVPGLLSLEQRQVLIDQLGALPAGTAGERELLDRPWCQALARRLTDHPALRLQLPADAVAVQCTLFEKSTERNWLVFLHQDLVIPVAERVTHPALTVWSVKGGRHFVLAPPHLLARMTALRLHLDDATAADGGLRFVPGSHQAGVLDDAGALHWRHQAGEVAVDARAGDALLMRPLVLHASSKATTTVGRRRVLHFLFGPAALPYGLRWAAHA
ncbi:phytanoyl-CoA dioxygenase family protein [Roseateles sp. DC23W]|uniref:Phytanoyl-CoA dioxygenase family protein n=1 Tax=Pelomonas dachongensis TaxID=3299029 RepID=A0ABW7ELK7_9BURK